jgi:hypothetical protein
VSRPGEQQPDPKDNNTKRARKRTNKHTTKAERKKEEDELVGNNGAGDTG